MSIRVRGPESKVTDRVTDEVTDAEKRILNCLKIDPGYSYTMGMEKVAEELCQGD